MPDTTTLHDQLAAALQTALETMFDVPVGHSITGDVRHIADDAKTLAGVADRILGQRVRELEDTLAHATQFGFPNGVTVTRSPWGNGWRIAWPDPDAPGDPARFHPLTNDREDRDEALARAKELARE